MLITNNTLLRRQWNIYFIFYWICTICIIIVLDAWWIFVLLVIFWINMNMDSYLVDLVLLFLLIYHYDALL